MGFGYQINTGFQGRDGMLTVDIAVAIFVRTLAFNLPPLPRHCSELVEEGVGGILTTGRVLTIVSMAIHIFQ